MAWVSNPSTPQRRERERTEGREEGGNCLLTQNCVRNIKLLTQMFQNTMSITADPLIRKISSKSCVKGM